MEKLLLPQKFEEITESEKDKFNEYKYEVYGKFAIYPFERGFGHTIGNSLRRILLSSLEGAAITSCRINNVLHEFCALPGVKEDVIYILMNLKKIRFKLYSGAEGPQKITLSVKGSKDKNVVVAGDFKLPPNVEIVNKNEYIASIDERGMLEIEAEVNKGRGYVLKENNQKPGYPVGTLFIDSIFSPVIKVNYEVEQLRVGERTDYDKLIIEVWTDGTIKPKDSIIYSAKVLEDNLKIFFKTLDLFEQKEEKKTDAEEQVRIRLETLLSQPIEVLGLSNRPRNCLKENKIRTIGDLVVKTYDELKLIRNLGNKSIEEIEQKLKEHNLSLGMKI
jgi:DNA-directed RNA polymerase subunit alpha